MASSFDLIQERFEAYAVQQALAQGLFEGLLVGRLLAEFTKRQPVNRYGVGHPAGAEPFDLAV